MDSTLLQTVKHGHGPGYDQVTKTHEAPRAALPPAAAEHQGSPGITALPWPARPANHRAPTRGHGSPRCLPSRRLPPKAPAWPPPGWLPPLATVAGPLHFLLGFPEAGVLLPSTLLPGPHVSCR